MLTGSRASATPGGRARAAGALLCTQDALAQTPCEWRERADKSERAGKVSSRVAWLHQEAPRRVKQRSCHSALAPRASVHPLANFQLACPTDPSAARRQHMHRVAVLLLLAAALPSSGLLRSAFLSSSLHSSTSHTAAPLLPVRPQPHARARQPLCSSAEGLPPAAELDAVDAQAAALALKKAEDREIMSIFGPALLNTLMDPFLGVVDTLFVARTCAPVALGAVAASSEIFTLCIAASLALRESASSTLVRLFAQGALAPSPHRPVALGVALRSDARAPCRSAGGGAELRGADAAACAGCRRGTRSADRRPVCPLVRRAHGLSRGLAAPPGRARLRPHARLCAAGGARALRQRGDLPRHGAPA